ncbi:hypothetical protein F2Q69_00006522 [Brassica cretica]|uniref:Uncharacterized protein n=1 Tax=Brassica cretica TaxID=69181 RepID=A0A8S9P2M2_BRACR|nr:hypothetical protein F2Q69_00006522 [Brassica cretica]
MTQNANQMRKIRVVQPDEYGVYRDENGNASALDGMIINVSNEDVEAILEMVDKSDFWSSSYTPMKIYLRTSTTKIDVIYCPLNNSIAWIRKTMEELQLKVDHIQWIIQRQQEDKTKGEEAIKSFVGTWFKMSKEDVDTCFPTSTQLPSYHQDTSKN